MSTVFGLSVVREPSALAPAHTAYVRQELHVTVVSVSCEAWSNLLTSCQLVVGGVLMKGYLGGAGFGVHFGWEILQGLGDVQPDLHVVDRNLFETPQQSPM